jgi:hypothetical protein
MPTPKSLRQAPARIFENYILTLSVDSNLGLTKVPQERFSQAPGNAGKSGQSGGLSGDTDIGFPFIFDGITYTKFNVSVDGWIVLVDPATTFTASDVLGGSTPYANIIKPTFLANHAFFAVWWSNLTNSSNAEILGTDGYNKGIEPPLARVNPRKFAIQYCNDILPFEGRRLIVRWNSTNAGGLSNRLEFEIIFYENGKIEFRYAPRNQISVFDFPVNESATIGIFMPNGTYRFRDFSYELGYDQSSRIKYSLGGSISGSYVDSVLDDFTMTYENVPYGGNLTVNNYWPGQTNSGAVFTFQPPLNRRKILPRLSLREKDSKITLPTVARTGDSSRPGNGSSTFDDRKSINYTTRNDINYPTTLPRFYAPTSFSEIANQNLFSEDIITTGSVNKTLVQDFLEDNSKSYISPFTENKLFENDPGSDIDPFFTVGSTLKDVGEGFTSPLKSKTQIRLSYRVDHKTTMFGASSSIYYFNKRTGRWQYPTSSFLQGFDIADPYADASNVRIIETDRGFNAFGFNISSGSNTRSYSSLGTDEFIGTNWTRQNEIKAITKSYNKSIQTDQRYSAIEDESISIPIQQPFLLEKAVIELPLEAGPGWFNDKTKCFIPLTDDSPYAPDELNHCFDIGGPGLTICLYNQVFIGPNKTRRDLILSGTVTHQLDNTAEIVFSNFPDIDAASSNWVDNGGQVWQVVPQGFNAYGTPSAVIIPENVGGNYYYTGSVVFKCKSEISNGTLIRDSILINEGYNNGSGGNDINLAKAKLDLLFSSSTWKYEGSEYFFNPNPYGGLSSFRYKEILSINNFGRGGVGFEPSGRSLLGKEYITTQGNLDYYDNPFYLYQGTTTLSDIKNAIGSYADAKGVVIASSIVNRSKSFTSPYLLLPGDRLILAASKSRPAFFSTLTSSPWTSGSIQHDIKFSTGSINITLYGSLVSNGSEFHDTLNQPLSSGAVHEVVIGETKK